MAFVWFPLDVVSVILDIPVKLCVKLWRLRSQLRRNTLPHCEQWYGLMSVCVSKCVFKFDRWLKLRLQTGHLCGDSSRWRILWTANVRDWQNPLPHSKHLKGFSFEWMYLMMGEAKEKRRWKKRKKRKNKKLIYFYKLLKNNA